MIDVGGNSKIMGKKSVLWDFGQLLTKHIKQLCIRGSLV